MIIHKSSDGSGGRTAGQWDEALLRALINDAVDGIVAIDEQGIVQLFNPAAERMFGYRADEILGHNINRLMPEPYHSEHDQYLQNYLTTGHKKIIGIGREVSGRRVDGSTFPLYLSVSEMRRGEQRLFTGIIQDLTVRKQAESILRSLAGSTALPTEDEFIRICIRDLANTYNARYAFAGVFADESKTSIKTLAVWDTDHFIEDFEYTLAGTPCRDILTRKVEIISSEASHRYPDDSLLAEMGVESYFGAPMVTSSGTTMGLVSVMDTKAMQPNAWTQPVLGIFANRMALELERKRSAQEMQRMRAYLENMINSMPSILVGVDPEGRITEWNRGAETATDVPAAEALGRGFAELFPEFESQLNKVQEAIHRRVPVRTERFLTERGRELRYADVMVYPLLANGVVGAVIRVDDITNRVRMEQMMVQTEKMMSVGGLAAGMAHEINNPLSGVLQSCQNIQRRLSLELSANRELAESLKLDLDTVHRYLEQRGVLDFIESIREAGMRASRIVADMLSFSRSSTQELVPVRVEELLETVLRLAKSDYDMKKKYDFKKVQIIRDYDQSLEPVPCDRTEIEQVFLNLIKNAAHAMVEGGSYPFKMTLRTHREGNYARIEVQDNGPGMDESTRRRVFEPFFTTKPAGVGTGLGLSVSYFIVTEQHKGRIQVSSAPGQGTRFVVRLPFAREST